MFEWFFKYPIDVYRSAELTYAFGGSVYWLLGGFAAATALLVAMLLTRRTLAPARRVGVFLAQLGLVAGLTWLLARPELVSEQPVRGSNTVALVLDDSSSMRYRDDGTSRLDAARAWLDDVAAELGDTYRIERLALSDVDTRLDSYADATADGTATPLAERLAALIERRRGDPLAAVIVASDGLATGTGADETMAALGAAGVPVHARRIGRDRVPEDVALTAADVPDEALAGAAFDAILTIRHDRAGEARVRVLANDDTLLAAETVPLEPSRTSTQVTLPLVIDQTGFQTLRFEVVPGAGEPEQRNNRLQRVLSVPTHSYRILYFEGEPRWEYKFMRRAIGADEDILLTSLLRVSPNKFYRQGLTDPSELQDGFPSDGETLFAYDAVILGSVEAAALTAEQQTLLHEFVSVRGGSLLLIAGANGLGNGGWGESALGRALPTRLPAFGTESFVRKRATVEPTVYGRSLPSLELAEDERGGWRDLPEIANYQVVGELRPAAESLLTVRTATRRQPLLVTQPYGRGRSFVLGTAGTWRWQMQLPVEDQRHERFWRQLLREMVTAAPRRAAVRATRLGGGVAVEAEFFDEQWQPLAGLSVSAAIDNGNGSETLTMTPVAERPGVYRGTLAEAGSGIRFVEATARRGDGVAATARSAFAGGGDPEGRRVRASDTVLAGIARASGGTLLGDASADLAGALRESAAGVTELRRQSIWDAPIVFLLLLALKTAEWLLRRRWGQI